MFKEKKDNLNGLAHFRLIFTKVLWSKCGVILYLWNAALEYFYERQLMVPPAMAEPFGESLGGLLRNPTNQLAMYALFGLWLALAVQLITTGIAMDF